MYTHAVAIARPDGQVVASYHNRDVSSAATEIANGLIRESALLHGWQDSFEVHTLSELTSRGSGLGVSSSIAVALATCFRRLSNLRDRTVDEPRWQDGGEEAHRLHVAREAWTAEIDRLRRPIGRQDHMAAAHGGLRVYAFEGNDASVEHSFQSDAADWLAAHLALVQLPDGHDSRVLLSRVRNPTTLEAAAAAVPSAISAIEGRDLRLLGEVLIAGHRMKAELPGAVTAEISRAIDRASSVPGVYGWKVVGAGGGGHVVLACEPRESMREAIAAATGLPVLKVEADHRGVRSDGYL